jgi:hypothetical protein
MSSGGQRGIDVSGVIGLRVQNASDVTHRLYLQEIYQTFNSNTANAPRNVLPNSTGYFSDFIQGIKEVGRPASDICGSSCVVCVGAPYVYRTPASGFTFRF